MKDVQLVRENVVQSTTSVSTRKQRDFISSSLMTIRLDLVCLAQSNHTALQNYPWCLGWACCLCHSTTQCKGKTQDEIRCCIQGSASSQKPESATTQVQEIGAWNESSEEKRHESQPCSLGLGSASAVAYLGCHPMEVHFHCSPSFQLVAGLNTVLSPASSRCLRECCIEPNKLLGQREA